MGTRQKIHQAFGLLECLFSFRLIILLKEKERATGSLLFLYRGIYVKKVIGIITNVMYIFKSINYSHRRGRV